ncbi:hypothetical protein DEU56DRAFT_975927 [Suillus clintonianus]|uniref:uncharacterized protein n=1 Tax=Suillus clintonianus TaxID=1904413 RepID=UPI001B85F031|nr:uncharacterized protein DEU56DRAFT_975927 [Suillus clintonianus]KAG2156350.1 hypothetical protein DEU56DRAFT_975927 [Suillus clintonianus]
MNTTDFSTVTVPQNALPPFVAFDAYVMMGPVVLGALVNACLFGGFVVQTYVYYAHFPNDSRVVKLTVAAILAAQIAHVICVSATLWNFAVSGYGNPLTMLVFPLGADAAILFTAITGALVESSFAFRLWKLSKTLFLPLLSLALCLAAQSIALAMTVKAFLMTNLVKFAHDQNTLITLSLTSRLVCELTLTLSMAWYLRKQRSSTFSRHAALLPICSVVMIYRTTAMIDRLVLWTLETGLMTRYVVRHFWRVGADVMLSLVVAFVMSFFLTMKQNYIWVGVYANIASVNANSFLASLNGRLILQSGANESLHMNTLTSSGGGRSKSQSVVINVTQSVGGPVEVFKYGEGEV